MSQLRSAEGFRRSVRSSQCFRYRFDLLLALFVIDVFGTPLGDEIVLKLPATISMETQR